MWLVACGLPRRINKGRPESPFCFVSHSRVDSLLDKPHRISETGCAKVHTSGARLAGTQGYGHHQDALRRFRMLVGLLASAALSCRTVMISMSISSHESRASPCAVAFRTQSQRIATGWKNHTSRSDVIWGKRGVILLCTSSTSSPISLSTPHRPGSWKRERERERGRSAGHGKLPKSNWCNFTKK